jgi:hypothetical protein
VFVVVNKAERFHSEVAAEPAIAAEVLAEPPTVNNDDKVAEDTPASKEGSVSIAVLDLYVLTPLCSPRPRQKPLDACPLDSRTGLKVSVRKTNLMALRLKMRSLKKVSRPRQMRMLVPKVHLSSPRRPRSSRRRSK